MDDVFNEIRNRLTMQEVVKFYGFEISRSGMVRCPFHADRTPSLKIYDDHFYCFGCGATGDQTGFAAKLFELSQIEAARKISYDLGLHLFDSEIAVPVNEKLRSENEFNRWQASAAKIVSDYLNCLCRWRRDHAPQKFSDSLDPLFEESLQNYSIAEYFHDVLRYGNKQEKRQLYSEYKGEIEKMKKRLDDVHRDEHTVGRTKI